MWRTTEPGGYLTKLPFCRRRSLTPEASRPHSGRTRLHSVYSRVGNSSLMDTDDSRNELRLCVLLLPFAYNIAQTCHPPAHFHLILCLDPARTRRVRRLVAVTNKDQDDNGGRHCVRRDGRLVQKKNFCATRLALNSVLTKNHPHPCSVMVTTTTTTTRGPTPTWDVGNT
ncbi:hypothetical protein KQX54_007898 [Cotesia glomerata]|uniref:Uncharacterized protein n=1 Tax=Cotesia glomerata TaxID=32391 RepID=A0AAV7J7L1_COTGL|nr:hypothetical protein KQX54_007898 [Cotesia glomerata]